MRLATITNWAYGATVALTLASASTMLLASRAQERERAAVEQRYQLDKATYRLGTDVYALSDHARQYLNTGDPTYRIVYERDVADLLAVEERISHIGDAGARAEELDALKRAIHWADTLHDEQEAAIKAFEEGNEALARRILFGAEYERELDQVRHLLQRFQDLLDRRTEAVLEDSSQIARLWKMISEITLALTGLLFLCVLYFVFRKRVLHPVVKLSDVVTRLAKQDYGAEPPEIAQIDEIGDMAQAIRVFRENGLERQRLEAERDADRTVRDLLSSMTQRLQSCESMADLQAIVQRFVPEIVSGYSGRLYLVDETRNAVFEACNWLNPTYSTTEFPPSACWALRRGLPHRPANGNIDMPCRHLALQTDELPDTICLPLIAQRETLGLLYLEVRADSDRNGETPEIYLSMVAENIGLALANLKLRDALREMAMTDALSGLSNRRRLDMLLKDRAIDWSNAPLSCIILDIDHFKRVNDSYGHDAGDAVLREVGSMLKKATRDPELAFRYGGEEFLLLLPDMDSGQAGRRAEKIRREIGELRLFHEGEQLEPISASGGLATAPEHCSVDRLVQTADAALYHAKARGRDRLEVAQVRQAQAQEAISRLA